MRLPPAVEELGTRHARLGRRPVRKVPVLAWLVPLLAALSGCDDWGGEQARQRLHLPPYGFGGDPVQGRTLYENVCAACHGVGAMGTDRGPPLVHRVYAPSHHPDSAFHLAVKQGVRQHHWQFGDMPAIDGLAPKQAAHIAAYVRSRQRLAGIE